MTEDSSLRTFWKRAGECLACLLVGWWLGGAGAEWLARLRISPREAEGSRAETIRATPSPITPAQKAVPAMSLTGAAAGNETEEIFSEWKEVPASLVTESDGVSFLGILNAQAAVDAQKKTSLWRDLLRLTPREHERLAEVLRKTMMEWARLHSTNMRHDDESPGYWRLAGEAGKLRALGERLQVEIGRAIGPEKAGLFNALAYQDMQNLFHPAQFAAREWPEGEFTLSSVTKMGSRTIFFDRETFGAAGIIAAEVKRLHQQQQRERSGTETKP